MKSLTVARKSKQKLNIKQRFSCGVGHVFNDLSRHLIMPFTIVFLMQVVKLSAFQAGIVMLIGQLADAFVSPLTGYLGDSVQIPFISKKMGRRKSWHLVGTLLMAVTLPLLFNECLLCSEYRGVSWLQFAYYICITAAENIAFNMVEINHVSIISNAAETVEEGTALNAIRTVFSFLSGIYVYLIAWGLLGQESGDDLGPENLTQFAHLSWIATGTGVIFAIIFYIGTKESKTNILLRRRGTLDPVNIGGLHKSRQPIYSMAFENLDDNRTESSFLDQAFIEIPISPGKRGKRKDEARDETKEHVIGLRNTSLPQQSTNDQLPIEDRNHHQDDSSSEGPQVSKPREVKFIEACVSDHRLERIVQNNQPEKFLVTVEGEFLGCKKGDTNENEPERSACGHYSLETEKTEEMEERATMNALQRKRGVSLTPEDGHGLALFNLGYQNEVEMTTKRETRKERKSKLFEEEHGSDRAEIEAGAIKVICKSAPASTPGKRNPKTVKDWLVDPCLYKVAVILTCSRLVQDAVYAYLPLYLTERLGFGMQAIAYFSLVLLVSAVLSSTVSDKLNTKIGSKWTYLLASLLVIGGSVYCYFQTPSLRQSTYAPVIMVGSGMSIMYVMALTFATGLIGKDKETSGSVFSIIVFIARMSSGGMFMIIQEFYPESTSKSTSEYVRYVFSMVPGILALAGSLMVLLLQSSPLCSSRKEYSPTEEAAAQTEASTTSFDAVLISESKTGCVSQPRFK